MRVAYLILAHGDPGMLKRLITAIDPSRREIFLLIDEKTDIGIYDPEILERVHVLEDRMPVYWGDSSVLEASIRLIEAAIAHGEFDYLTMMSGADFPIRPLREFEEFLSANAPTSFVESRSVENYDEARKRIITPYVIHERTRVAVLVQKILFFVCLSVPWLRRKPVADLTLRIGENWFTLHRSTIDPILALWRRRDVRRFFTRTYIPEEMFFGTALASGSDPAPHSPIPLRYTLWSGEPHPATLQEAHFDRIVASRKFFARKFSTGESSAVLDRLAKLL